MSLTIANWFIIGFIGLTGLGFSGYLFLEREVVASFVSIIITVILCGALMFGLNWYHTSTASGIRNYKDFTSEMSNGINREITITAEDGREIFHYKGKIDLEMESEGNYLRFETQDGKRYNIEYGVQDTVVVIEK